MGLRDIQRERILAHIQEEMEKIANSNKFQPCDEILFSTIKNDCMEILDNNILGFRANVDIVVSSDSRGIVLVDFVPKTLLGESIVEWMKERLE